MILLAYDGSADANAAIDSAARIMPGVEVMVLTVWEPFIDALTRSGPLGIDVGMGLAAGHGDAEKIDAATRRQANAQAWEGAQRATAAGLVASPASASRDGGIGSTILALAARTNAEAIVLGTRGRGALTSRLLGSVSHDVVQHAGRPVLMVPSAGGARGARYQPVMRITRGALP